MKQQNVLFGEVLTYDKSLVPKRTNKLMIESTGFKNYCPLVRLHFNSVQAFQVDLNACKRLNRYSQSMRTVDDEEIDVPGICVLDLSIFY